MEEEKWRKTDLIAPVAFPASLASALVCSSLHPLNEMTSAEEVLVLRVFSVPDPPEETCLKVDWRPVFERKRGERRGQSPVRQDEKEEQEKEEEEREGGEEVRTFEQPTHVALEVRHPRSQQTLASLGEKVRLLDLALGGVDVRQIEGRSGVALRFSRHASKSVVRRVPPLRTNREREGGKDGGREEGEGGRTESKMAVNRHPAGRGATMIACISSSMIMPACLWSTG